MLRRESEVAKHIILTKVGYVMYNSNKSSRQVLQVKRLNASI